MSGTDQRSEQFGNFGVYQGRVSDCFGDFRAEQGTETFPKPEDEDPEVPFGDPGGGGGFPVAACGLFSLAGATGERGQQFIDLSVSLALILVPKPLENGIQQGRGPIPVEQVDGIPRVGKFMCQPPLDRGVIDGHMLIPSAAL